METTNQTPKEEVKATPKKTPTIPRSQVVLSGVANTVAIEWNLNKDFTLRYTTCDLFTGMAGTFHTGINNALALNAATKPLEKEMKDLNKQITTGLPFVKNYLAEKYGKDGALAYYPVLGIVKEVLTYLLCTKF